MRLFQLLQLKHILMDLSSARASLEIADRDRSKLCLEMLIKNLTLRCRYKGFSAYHTIAIGKISASETASLALLGVVMTDKKRVLAIASKARCQISGSIMLIWAPGKKVRFLSRFFPFDQSGMMESLAVPERIESFPFHSVTKRRTAARP